MPLLIVPVLFVLAMLLLIPVSLIQRYRVGTSRQRARGWLAGLNLVGLLLETPRPLTFDQIRQVLEPYGQSNPESAKRMLARFAASV